ncbi:MAG: triple tyrosine motif-containing protein [Chitinophagaceae bacterium]
MLRIISAFVIFLLPGKSDVLFAQSYSPVITSFKVAGKVYHPAPRIRLSSRDNSFSFDYVSSNIDVRSVRYAYKLEEFDKEWIDAGDRTYVNYTNIPGGTYRFKVKCTVDGSNWIEIKDPITIYIDRPFHETGWFTVLIAITILMATGLVINYAYRIQLQRILTTQKIRNDIASDLHDDIGSSLSSIMLMSELAKNQPQDAIRYFNQISTNAQQVIENMNDIVWAVNPNNDSMMDIIARMQHFASGILEKKNMILQFDASPELETIKLDMHERKNMYLIFKETINNAVKYAKCGTVKVKIHTADQKIIMKIEDDGEGFDTTKKYMGNGLPNLRKRAEEINGTLLIDAVSGQGTVVMLTLKTTQTGS